MAVPVYHNNGASAHGNNSNSSSSNTNGNDNTRYNAYSEPADLAGSDMPVELPAGPGISFFVPPPPAHLTKVVNNEPVELPEDTAVLRPTSQPSSSVTTSFPPPPPGPPPASTERHDKPPEQQEQQEEYHYPPPPPGPPPNHQAHNNIHTHVATAGDEAGPTPPKITGPDYDDDEPPPSYEEEFGAGPSPSPAVTDVKLPPPPLGPPPTLPPRPVSASGSSVGGASIQQQFPPPPLTPPPSSSSAWGKRPNSSSGDENASGSGGGSGHGNGGFGEKLYRWGVKAGMPVNRLANRLGSEAFWPMTMDLECDKAARILKSFCQDGFYTTDQGHKQQAAKQSAAKQSASTSSPSSPPKKPSHSRTPSSQGKVLVKIPASVIAGAQGLAIFTTFRTGLHISGAGGSGVVVARLPDGSWSPPAGFLVHTLGAGFMVGIDVYDCVCVLTTRAAVDTFARCARVSLGGEIAVVAGPVGIGGVLEGFVGSANCNNGGPGGQQQQKSKVTADGNGNVTNVSTDGTGTGTGNTNNASGAAAEKNKPVWSYMKSRGFYAGVQADGTVIIPRADANAAFYGERNITVEKILKGQVPINSHQPQRRQDKKKDKDEERDLVMWPEGGQQLVEVLKSAEGKRADDGVLRGLGTGPTPGDLASHPDGGRT